MSVDVDVYNAASLKNDLLVRDPPVTLPFLAVQNGITDDPTAIATIKAYVSDQVESAVSDPPASIGAPAKADIPAVVVFRPSGNGFVVTATDGDDPAKTTIGDGVATIKIEATADLKDTSTDFPFSRVDFYVAVTVGDISELRFIESVAGNSATVKTLGDTDSDERRELDLCDRG